MVKIISTDDHQDYLNNVNEKSDFLGGQQSKKLYAELRKKIPLSYTTPIDTQVYALWKSEAQKYYGSDNNSNTPQQALKDIQEKVYSTFNKEIEILKKHLLINR